MFLSLNKKFVYTIISFFLFTSLLFIYTFYIIYGIRFQEEQKSILMRNQQYLELLYENNQFRSELSNIIYKNPTIKINNEIKNRLKQFDKDSNTVLINSERTRISQLIKNYDDRYATIKEGFRLVSSSSILILMAIICFWFLIRHWILTPLNLVSNTCLEITKGNLSHRVQLNTQHKFYDEIDILVKTFNLMLKNLEQYISEIKKKENFLQSMIDGIPDGIRVIDSKYNIIIANKAYYTQVGNNKKHIKCYASSQNRSDPCPATMFTCPIQEICHEHKNNSHIIQQFIHHPECHLDINAAPLSIKDDNKKYIIEVIRDLSNDIKFSHQQKLSSLAFLTTSVAHEMKNHLGSIRMILESTIEKYFADKPEDDNAKKLLTLIHEQLIESINVPERLLKISRANGEQSKIINCSDNIKDTISLLDYEAKHAGIEIIFTPNDNNICVQGFEPDFKMILVNLLLNAIKAIKNKGTITIDQSQNNNFVEIKISDNGIGIAPENLQRIFEPFYSESQHNNDDGNGLGLPIVKSIMGKFNGSINVDSEINVGTTFTLKFPSPIKK